MGEVLRYPVLAIDDQLYTSSPNLAWDQPVWRDPFLFEESGTYYQLITAADPHRPPEVSGTVALAQSVDLKNWTLLPPLDVPAIAQDLECPKLCKIDGRYYLTVSISRGIIGPELLAQQPEGLLIDTAYTLVADSFQGPYTIHGSGRILEDETWCNPYPYACEPVCFKGKYFLLGTIWTPNSLYAVCDPIPLEATDIGFKAHARQ